MALHDVLARRRTEVVERWKLAVRGTLAPDAMPHTELVDHIPQFVDEIIAALRKDAGLDAGAPSPEQGATAAGHGAQRLRLGFSLDSVVREYGALRDAIIAEGSAGPEPLTLREVQVLFDGIVKGIAHAVSAYARQRDAELQRQANEHFAFIAHELRNPLSNASLAFQVLKSAGALPNEPHSVAALERGLARASELIEQTLEIARVGSGVELQRTWTTLADLIEDAELGADAEAKARGVELRISVEHDERMHVDVRLVRSALSNLIRNAIKYTAPCTVVHVRGRALNGRVVMEVEDACGGVDPVRVEAAFAPFVRLNREEKGFGLGLAIAKQAADAHGGSIRVQNMPGAGCIFVIELPTTEPERAP
jgi:signal transduction histidine kinase